MVLTSGAYRVIVFEVGGEMVLVQICQVVQRGFDFRRRQPPSMTEGAMAADLTAFPVARHVRKRYNTSRQICSRTGLPAGFCFLNRPRNKVASAQEAGDRPDETIGPVTCAINSREPSVDSIY